MYLQARHIEHRGVGRDQDSGLLQGEQHQKEPQDEVDIAKELEE